MTSQKIRQYLTLTCKSHTKITNSHKIGQKNQKNMAVIQPRPTHILYQCAKFGDDRTIGRHLTSFLTCATFNM